MPNGSDVVPVNIMFSTPFRIGLLVIDISLTTFGLSLKFTKILPPEAQRFMQLKQSN
jgi:hypothetical protein